MADDKRIADITLDERTVLRRSQDVEHERAVAIYDLLEENRFAPIGVDHPGPFNLHLGIEENRLILDVRDTENTGLARIPVPTLPFRKLIRDYFAVCESYYSAIRTASPSKIEAIDMGRRGLHNEGSDMLRASLEGKVEIDFDTARRLFTLLCVLHIRG